MDYIIEMCGITKEFPGIIANDDITLQLKKGEIHALLGENGAGKSTLMSVLFGMYQPEKGVIKKNGEKTMFDRDKLAKSIQIAVRKRPVNPERVEKVVNSIQRRLESSGEAEIQSRVIGEYVMEALSKLDHIAYIRFASVYKDFREVKDFENFVETIDKLARPNISEDAEE